MVTMERRKKFEANRKQRYKTMRDYILKSNEAKTVLEANIKALLNTKDLCAALDTVIHSLLLWLNYFLKQRLKVHKPITRLKSHINSATLLVHWQNLKSQKSNQKSKYACLKYACLENGKVKKIYKKIQDIIETLVKSSAAYDQKFIKENKEFTNNMETIYEAYNDNNDVAEAKEIVCSGMEKALEDLFSSARKFISGRFCYGVWWTSLASLKIISTSLEENNILDTPARIYIRERLKKGADDLETSKVLGYYEWLMPLLKDAVGLDPCQARLWEVDPNDLDAELNPHNEPNIEYFKVEGEENNEPIKKVASNFSQEGDKFFFKHYSKGFLAMQKRYKKKAAKQEKIKKSKLKCKTVAPDILEIENEIKHEIKSEKKEEKRRKTKVKTKKSKSHKPTKHKK